MIQTKQQMLDWLDGSIADCATIDTQLLSDF
jgi:hypothetical protein